MVSIGFGQENALEPGGKAYRITEEAAAGQQPAVNKAIGERHTAACGFIRPGGGDNGGHISACGAVLRAGRAQSAAVKLLFHFFGGLEFAGKKIAHQHDFAARHRRLYFFFAVNGAGGHAKAAPGAFIQVGFEFFNVRVIFGFYFHFIFM